MDKDRRTSKLFGSRISSIFNPHTNPNASEVKSPIAPSPQATSKSIQLQQTLPTSRPLSRQALNSTPGNGLEYTGTGSTGTSAGESGWTQREPTTPVKSSFLSPNQNDSSLRQADHVYQQQVSDSGNHRAGVSPSPRPLHNFGGNNRYSQQSNTTTTSGTTINSDGSMSVLRPMTAIPDHLKLQIASPNKNIPEHLKPQMVSPNKGRMVRKPPPSDDVDNYNKNLQPTKTPPTPPPPVHTVRNPAVLDRIPLFDSLQTTPLPLAAGKSFLSVGQPVGLESSSQNNNNIGKLRRSGDRADLLDIIGTLENDIQLLSPGEHNHEYQEDIDFIDDIDPLYVSRLGKTGLPLPKLSINYDDANPFIYGDSESESQRSQRDSNYDTSGAEGSFTDKGSNRQSSSSLLLKSAYDSNNNGQDLVSFSSDSRADMGHASGGDLNLDTSRSGSLSVTNKLGLVDSVPYPIDSSNSSLNSPVDSYQPIFSGNSIEGRQYDSARGSASINSGVMRRNSQRQAFQQQQQQQQQQPQLLMSLVATPFLIIPPPGALSTTSTQTTQVPPASHRKSSSISSLMSASSFRNVNLGSLKRTYNLQPGEGERSNYVMQIRRSAGTSYNESQPGKWKLPIGILPVDKNANYTLSNGRYIRLAGASQGRVKKGNGVELKHGHLAPRLLAAEVEDMDSSIPGMNSRLGRAGTTPSLQMKSNNIPEKNKSSSSSIQGSNITRTTTRGDSQSIVTGGESANSERTRSLSSSSSGSVPDAYLTNYQHPGYRMDDDDDASEVYNELESDAPQSPHINKSNGYGGRMDVDTFDENVGTGMNGLHLNGDYESTNGYDLDQEDRQPRLVLANPDASDSD